jgi:hypothetical protein
MCRCICIRIHPAPAVHSPRRASPRASDRQNRVRRRPGQGPCVACSRALAWALRHVHAVRRHSSHPDRAPACASASSGQTRACSVFYSARARARKLIARAARRRGSTCTCASTCVCTSSEKGRTWVRMVLPCLLRLKVRTCEARHAIAGCGGAARQTVCRCECTERCRRLAPSRCTPSRAVLHPHLQRRRWRIEWFLD